MSENLREMIAVMLTSLLRMSIPLFTQKWEDKIMKRYVGDGKIKLCNLQRTESVSFSQQSQRQMDNLSLHQKYFENKTYDNLPRKKIPEWMIRLSVSRNDTIKK